MFIYDCISLFSIPLFFQLNAHASISFIFLSIHSPPINVIPNSLPNFHILIVSRFPFFTQYNLTVLNHIVKYEIV